jgi:hypothetical protein
VPATGPLTAAPLTAAPLATGPLTAGPLARRTGRPRPRLTTGPAHYRAADHVKDGI